MKYVRFVTIIFCLSFYNRWTKPKAGCFFLSAYILCFYALFYFYLLARSLLHFYLEKSFFFICPLFQETELSKAIFQTKWLRKKKMKYVVVSGGVVSGLGKGVTASSIGLILKSCGFRVTAIKIGLFFSPYYKNLVVVSFMCVITNMSPVSYVFFRQKIRFFSFLFFHFCF